MKKGQLQIQETIIVLFICVILILMGLGIFYKYTAQTISQEQIEYEQKKFDGKLITLPTHPLLVCSQLTQKQNCVDTAKAIAVTKLDQKKLKKEFKEAKITLQITYPEQSEKECTFQNPTGCNTYTIYNNQPTELTSTRIIETPVSVFNPLTNTYAIGKLSIEGYNI